MELAEPGDFPPKLPIPPGVDPGGDSEIIEDAELFAILVSKGWSKSQILDEDPWFIRNIVFHYRDKDGNIALRHKKPVGVSLTQRQAFFLRARSLNIPDWQIERMYEEELDNHDKAQNEIFLRIAEMKRKLG